MNEFLILFGLIVIVALLIVIACLILVLKKGIQVSAISKNPEKARLEEEDNPSLTTTSSISLSDQVEIQQEMSLAPNKLLLGDENDAWGEIARFEVTSSSRLEELPLNQNILSKCGPFFQYAPSLLVTSKVAATKLYKMTYTPELQHLMKQEGYHHMKSLAGGIRAAVVDSKNVIRGQGSLHKLNGLRLASAAASLWQIAAIVTAQKFLADINKQLEKLNKSVQGIKEFLEQQEYAKLVGSLSYLSSIRNSLNSQELFEADLNAFRNQIEEVELITHQSISFLQDRMGAILTNFTETEIKKNFLLRSPSKEKIEEMVKLVEDYRRLAMNYLVALSVRGQAAHLLCALPGSQTLALTRMEEVHKELLEWREGQEKFYELIDTRLPEMEKGFGRDKAEYQTRFKTLARLGQFNSDEAYEQLEALISRTVNNLQEKDSFEFVVELDENNNPVKVSRLLTTGAREG